MTSSFEQAREAVLSLLATARETYPGWRLHPPQVQELTTAFFKDDAAALRQLSSTNHPLLAFVAWQLYETVTNPVSAAVAQAPVLPKPDEIDMSQFDW